MMGRLHLSMMLGNGKRMTTYVTWNAPSEGLRFETFQVLSTLLGPLEVNPIVNFRDPGLVEVRASCPDTWLIKKKLTLLKIGFNTRVGHTGCGYGKCIRHLYLFSTLGSSNLYFFILLDNSKFKLATKEIFITLTWMRNKNSMIFLYSIIS